MAASLVCGASVFTACSGNDYPVKERGKCMTCRAVQVRPA